MTVSADPNTEKKENMSIMLEKFENQQDMSWLLSYLNS
jgi:hypothetical protein